MHSALITPSSHSSLVVLSVRNKSRLEKALAYVNEQGIKTYEWFEGDWDYGFTSFATEPLTIDQKALLRGFSLWKPENDL